jgi:predicted nucleic acid-binding protein
MLIYLDMCCLKRPFDDQSQVRIRLESEAVLGLLALESKDARFVRSPALTLENSLNPVKERSTKVGLWLAAEPEIQFDAKILQARTTELIALGLKNFDAIHIAAAEQAKADVFASCDDRLLKAAARIGDRISVRVASVVDLAREILT